MVAVSTWVICFLRELDHGSIEVVNREGSRPWTRPYVQDTNSVLAHWKAILLNESL